MEPILLTVATNDAKTKDCKLILKRQLFFYDDTGMATVANESLFIFNFLFITSI